MSFFSYLFNRKEQDKIKGDFTEEAVSEEGEDEESDSIAASQEEEGDGSSDDTEEEYEVVEREILPNKIICPDCGGITLEGLDFCDKCGGELH